MNLKDKILAGLREAAEFAKANPGSWRVSNYKVRLRGDRAAVTNTDTGQTSIVPTPR